MQPVDALEDDDVPLECDVALLDETVRRGEEAEAVQVAAARPPHSPHELPHGTVKEKKRLRPMLKLRLLSGVSVLCKLYL